MSKPLPLEEFLARRYLNQAEREMWNRPEKAKGLAQLLCDYREELLERQKEQPAARNVLDSLEQPETD